MLIPDSLAAHPVRTFVHDALLYLHQYNVDWLINCGASRQREQLTAHVLQRLGSQLHFVLISITRTEPRPYWVAIFVECPSIQL